MLDDFARSDETLPSHVPRAAFAHAQARHMAARVSFARPVFLAVRVLIVEKRLRQKTPRVASSRHKPTRENDTVSQRPGIFEFAEHSLWKVEGNTSPDCSESMVIAQRR